MTRTEARVLLAVGLACIGAAVTWLLGPFGLLGFGVVLTVVVLFAVDVKESTGEAVAGAAGRPAGDRTLQR